MPWNGTRWCANAVEATVIVCVQCGGLSARQRPGFHQSERNGTGSWVEVGTQLRQYLTHTLMCLTDVKEETKGHYSNAL